MDEIDDWTVIQAHNMQDCAEEGDFEMGGEYLLGGLGSTMPQVRRAEETD